MIKVDGVDITLKGNEKEIISDFGILIRRLMSKFGKEKYNKIYRFLLNEIEEFEREIDENTSINIHKIEDTNKNEILKQLEGLHVPDFVKKFIISQLEV